MTGMDVFQNVAIVVLSLVSGAQGILIAMLSRRSS